MAFSLAFATPPPDHPFVGEYFPVHLSLIDADHEIHGGIEVPLSLELYYEEKDKQAPKAVFEMEGGQKAKIGKNGMCAVKLHITKSSMELDNRRFVVKASGKLKNGAKVEVWSEPLRVMRYKLVIEEGGILDHDEVETRKMKDAAAVWYKDEGGREKCILLKISLEDGKGVKIKDRPVRLKCLLRYADSNVPVTNQNVLRVWTDSQDGKATLKLNRGSLAIKARVEDVSKNHQGQSFKIEVGPDIDGSLTDCDVSMAVTRVVNVRSKRNKRRRAPTSNSPPRSRSPPPVTTTNSFAHAPGVAGWIEAVMEGLDEMKWDPGMQELANPNALIAKLERRFESDVAPHLDAGSASKKKRKVTINAPRSVPIHPPPMLRARTSAAMALDALDAAERGALAAFPGADEIGLSAGLQSPMVARGVSSLYTGGPTGDGSGHDDSGVLPPFTATPESLAEEPRVRVILAKRFRPARGTTSLGYPAYDGAKNLVGLYRDDGGAPIFTPASNPASLLEAADYPAARVAYDREIKGRSACVHDLDTFSSLDALNRARLGGLRDGLLVLFVGVVLFRVAATVNYLADLLVAAPVVVLAGRAAVHGFAPHTFRGVVGQWRGAGGAICDHLSLLVEHVVGRLCR